MIKESYEPARATRRQLTPDELVEAFKGLPEALHQKNAEMHIGQESAKEQLAKFMVKAPYGSVAIISEPLGTGKTSIIASVKKDLSRSKYCDGIAPIVAKTIFDKEPEPEYVDSNFDSDALILPTDPTVFQDQVVVIEEFDRKVPFDRLRERMRMAKGILNRYLPPVMVITGDGVVRNPKLIEELELSQPPTYIPLEHLTPESFKKALELRLQHALKTDDQLDIDAIIDPVFLSRLIPNAQFPIATPRSTFVKFLELASCFDPENEKNISGETWINLRLKHLVDDEDSNSRRPKQKVSKLNGYDWFDYPELALLSWLHSHVPDLMEGGRKLEPMSSEYIKTKYPYNDLTEEEIINGINVLNRLGIILPCGIPYLNDDTDFLPEPFLPSQELILDAFYSPIVPQD